MNLDANTAQTHGLDVAIIDALHDQYRQIFDEGFINETQFRALLRVEREVLNGGAIMIYLAYLRDEAQDAMVKLAVVDPSHTFEIIKAQQAVGRFKHLLEWLKGSIGQKPQNPADESLPDDM